MSSMSAYHKQRVLQLSQNAKTLWLDEKSRYWLLSLQLDLVCEKQSSWIMNKKYYAQSNSFRCKSDNSELRELQSHIRRN